jgi:hypothetical protein
LSRAVRNLVVLVALAALVAPASAGASAAQVLRDCITDGKLDRKYSNAELRKARDNMPADSDEYSDCSDVIAAAIKGGSDRGSNAGSPGVGGMNPQGEAIARREDGGDLAAITAGGDDAKAPAVDVGGTSLAPDSSGFFNLAGAANDVPLPLLIALILLALFAMASATAALRERVPALARIPLLSKIPRVPFIQRRR